MDPFLFALIMAFLLVKGPLEDLTFARKGMESPRIRARKERMENKSVAAKLAHAAADRLSDRIVSGPKPKGPLRKYCSGLWEDAWDTATDSRRRAKEERAAKAKDASDRAGDTEPLGEVPDPPRGDSSAGEDAGGRATSGDGAGRSSTSDEEPSAPGGDDGTRGRRRWWRRRPSWWTWYSPPPPEVAEDPVVVKATAERTDGPEPEEPKPVTAGRAALPAGSSDSDGATAESATRAGSADGVLEGEVVDADVLCDKNCTNSTISPAEARAQGLCPNCGGRGDRRTKDFHGLHEHIKCNVCGGGGKFKDPNDKSPEDTSTENEPASASPTTERTTTTGTPEADALPGGTSTMTTSTDTAAGSEGGLTNSAKWGRKMMTMCDKSAASLEQTIGSLRAEDYSGDPVDGFARAIELFTAAKAAIEVSVNALEIKGGIVKDAYTAAPEIGTKESVNRE